MTLVRSAALAFGIAASGAAAALDGSQVAAAVVERTNAFREEQGLEPLRTNAVLREAAKRFALYMAKTGKYGHAADGRAPTERATEQGYAYCIVAENIAYQYRAAGFADAAALARALVQGWKNSPEHRKNMVDPSLTEIGVGVAQGQAGRWLAVQMFGRPESAAIRFSVANRGSGLIDYRLGEERLTLPPRTTRTHKMCRAETLAIGERFRAPVVDGASYAVGEGGAVSSR